MSFILLPSLQTLNLLIQINVVFANTNIKMDV